MKRWLYAGLSEHDQLQLTGRLEKDGGLDHHQKLVIINAVFTDNGYQNNFIAVLISVFTI